MIISKIKMDGDNYQVYPEAGQTNEMVVTANTIIAFGQKLENIHFTD